MHKSWLAQEDDRYKNVSQAYYDGQNAYTDKEKVTLGHAEPPNLVNRARQLCTCSPSQRTLRYLITNDNS